ncbi:sensor histidine kinase [Pinibacter aurantiacus]|uniref:histidine kinase n=1 Tax=Pinibacter aurantiacus TaxID=2851599 RepID=A0A9E2SBQ0_9BACT|nr:ATP-binding protein [Pinibacter aurantiacus]MBV4359606.1 PAS domain-containing protein [Pinibacter aurantiacus]
MNLNQPLKDQSSSLLSVIKTDGEFEDMVNKAPVGVCKMAFDGTLLYVNEKLARFLDLSPADAIGRNYLDFYKSETNTGYHYWQELMRSGDLPFYHGWVDLTSKNNEIIPCHLNMQHIKDDEGNAQYFLCIFDRFAEEQVIQQHLYEERISYQQSIATTILKAQEKERAFLAEELHDNINQLLATTKLYIDSARSAKPEQLNELLERSSIHVVQVINELRNLSKRLTPPSVENTSLVNNIVNLFQDTEKLSGIAVEIIHTGFDESNIGKEKKLMIYRILQEQFNNILKHAECSKISVNIRNKGPMIELIVEDNGKGFNTTTSYQNGLGLKNIRNRVDLYNGRCSVYSAPGKGCRVHIEFEG